ncbi:MAG: class I SAM-dependent methyltransferase [Verrucomicrobia bacterium]|nr:class I SAM-dependent methyltransferase [Verrucomicrobiota bacterium]
MSISVRPHAELTASSLQRLERALTDFYTHPPPSYYTTADQNSGSYTQASTPFHLDLVTRVQPGAALLELGCGTAHLCPYVTSRGGAYTGMDHSAVLLADNLRRFPHARFFPIQSDPGEVFDIVASLYTIEHVVDPPAYLERMWTLAKPGGVIAVICPDFVDGESLPPSLYYGKTTRRLREKIVALDWIDACRHLIELKCAAPRWKARARAHAPGAFWMNLAPRVLHGAAYSIDADAVHLPRLTDLLWWLERRGAEILTTSHTLAGIEPAALRHNCYAVARKPQ